jgi:hypothetical protein
MIKFPTALQIEELDKTNYLTPEHLEAPSPGGSSATPH